MELVGILLRSHVKLGSSSAFDHIRVAREPKIADSQLRILMNEYIFSFKISMSDSLGVDVREPIYDLPEIVFTSVFAESIHELDHGEEIAV